MAGASIVALDATFRQRPNGETFEAIIDKIKKKYPHILIMADCATFKEALLAEQLDVDFIGTTLRGYTKETKYSTQVDFDLIKQLATTLDVPIIAEGRIRTKDEAKKAIECGAHSVVVGTAITRPEVITKWFADELKNVNK